MSQLSRTSSTYSVYVNGKETIHIDSDDEEENDETSLQVETAHPFSSQVSQFSQATTDVSSNAATDIIELSDDSEEDDLACIRATALSQPTSSVHSSPSETFMQERTLSVPILTRKSQTKITHSASESILTSRRFLSPPTDEDEGSAYEPLLSDTISKKRKGTRIGDDAPRKRRKTIEEIAAEKALKAEEREATRIRKQLEKDIKLAEKMEAKERKAHEKAEQEAEKTGRRKHSAANKLVTDKKATLADMIVEVSPPLLSHPAFSRCLYELQRKLEENKSSISHFKNNSPFPLVMRWSRRVDKEFDEESREWEAVEQPYEALELIFGLFYTADDLLRNIRSNENQIVQQIGLVKQWLEQQRERTVSNLSKSGWKIILVVFGVEAFCGGKSSNIRETFERFSIRVNVYHKAHVVLCENPEDFAQKLLDISADQGIKQYKLIKRSHLPYVSDISVKPGTDLKETYRNMLAQNYKFTRPVVDAVVNAKPSLMQLMSSYAEIEDQAQRELLFERVMVHRYRDEGQTSKSMNVSLSRRLHATTFGNDPLAFVGPDTAANKHL